MEQPKLTISKPANPIEFTLNGMKYWVDYAKWQQAWDFYQNLKKQR